MARPNQRSFYSRYAIVILLATLILTPVVFYSAYRTVRSNTNKVADWLPATFRETDDLKWFRQLFTADQFVVVSWEGCRLGDSAGVPKPEDDDPRIERLAQMLVPSSDAAQSPASSSGYFKSVNTGRRLLNKLTSPPMNVPYDVAVERLKGSLIGPDGRQTCVVVVLTNAAVSELRKAVGRGSVGPLGVHRGEGVLLKAIRASGIDPQEVHLGGPPVDNASIDEEGERTLMRLAGLAALVGLLLSWGSLRSVRLTAIVFACGLLSASAGLAMVWLTGATSDAVLLSMPALVYVLAISGAVHLINYYRAAVEESGVAGAAGWAIARGARPALLCSVTTALGLLSLCTSDLTPIRKFGFYSALGVMMTLVVLFLFLPAALEMWPEKQRGRQRRKGKGSSSGSFWDRWRRRIPLVQFDLWQNFGGWIIRHHRWVSAACLSIIVAVGLGVFRIETSIDLMKLFGEEARILQDYRWLEANVGRLVPMEIVLKVDQSAIEEGRAGSDERGLSLLDRLEIVSRVGRTIEQHFGGEEGVVGPPLSAVSFVPPLPQSRKGASSVLRRSITNSKLEQAYGALLESGYLEIDPADGTELWRISLRVAAFEDIDYGAFSNELRQLVEPAVAEANERVATVTGQPAGSALSTVYTGVVPIVYKAQRALLGSLIESTMWSFLTITPLLMFVSRGVRAGLVTMLPNVLPVLVIFGGMGHLGFKVDIGSMMSASIALGVAVDDTIHYLTWFRHDLDRSRDRHSAILSAYRHCATPTLQAALINGLGLSVFAFSTFTPTRQFGYLMLTILIAGVVAELVLLPALLAGPLGRVFRPAPVKTEASQPAETSPTA